ncbi:MAG: hypothetical protein ACLQK4_07470 [Acidimicrobiales bacterium]|jgi:hypothetical protein
MTLAAGTPRGETWRLLALLAAVLGLLTIGCSRATTAARQPTDPLALALPTSFASSGASWALIPMGRLGSEANTFWQLIVRPPGSSRWALVTPAGVADNGGMVVRDGESRPLAIGFPTSGLLEFSPLASTADAGRTWSGGILPSALTPVPDALAGSSRGGSVALLGRGGKSVVSNAGGLSGWRTVATRKAVTAAGARSCGVGAFTAVALAGAGGGTPVLGTACDRRGHVGLLELSGGSWKDVGPRLSGALSSATTEVAGITPDGAGIRMLVAARAGSRWSLIDLTESAVGASWEESDRLAIGSGERIQAIGTAPGGLFVLLARGSAAAPRDEQLDVLGQSARRWEPVAAPPPGTQTVAYGSGAAGPATEPDALVVDRSLLTAYQLGPSGAWMKVQVMRVPILYGSSS